jgi:3'-phosphoadenosine 5'-phosphosulfate sulfotransferase (PAPS reductase)/FAD synthetase
MQTIELFTLAELQPSLEAQVAQALQNITRLFHEGRLVLCQFSAGKDSGVVAALVLEAARAFTETGGKPLVCVVTVDTLIESPEMVEHAQRELQKMRQYAAAHGFSMTTQTVYPSMAATWQLSILSGRALPSYAGQNADCATSLKIQPSRAFRNKLYRKLAKQGAAEPVVCLGTRFSESDKRRAAMRERGDRADAPVRNEDGDLVLCPIAQWTTETVWEYIGEVASGLRSSYTDFAETTRIYAHAGNSSCAIVSDLSYEEASAGKRKRKGACSARTGCWACQQAEDRSLEEMINFSDERYSYARGLNKLNKFIRAIRYDHSRRNWVGRTIREGFVCVEPDTLSASAVRELTRYMLQLDFDEALRARRAGTARKFEILPLPMMIAVDAMQSLQGLAKPFSVWADYRDIYLRGIRYDVPDVADFPPAAMPEPLFLHVGRDWDDSAGGEWTGFRDALHEALTEGAPCAPQVLKLPDGSETWRANTAQMFDVDPESAELILEYEVDRLLAQHDRGFFPGGITAGYRWYLSYGALTLSHVQQREHDAIARRTAFKDRLGLTLQYDLDDLRRRAVRYGAMPAEAREAWAHKATTAGAQAELAWFM